MITTTDLNPCPMFIDGEWVEGKDLPTLPVYNPSTGEVISETPLADAGIVNQAVQSAKDVFPAWSETPPLERVRVLFRYRMLLEENFESLSEMITREHGKTLGESRGSMQRGLESVEYACGISEMLMGDIMENVAAGIDCEMLKQPLGVCAGITPFNFPVMVPLWMFPLALACGNTFVLKPSEKVPLSAVRMIELLVQAGLPKGVLNLVHGAKTCVDAILTHPGIQAISFVGSSPVAKYIYETGSRHGKRVQANGGAKNYIIVMPDADIAKTVDGLAEGAFGCAGERCMASSTAIAVGSAGDLLTPVLVDAAKSIKVGPTDRLPQPKMGPVITGPHRDRIIGLITGSAAEGAKIIADGRSPNVPEAPQGFYVGATVVDHVRRGMTIDKEEVFGPVLNVIRVDDLESAIALANASPYGNGTAIYTQSGRAAREFKHRVNVGMVGINVGVPASMAMFPFTGWNESFYGDRHMQGREGADFYLKRKVVTSRWFAQGEGDVWRKT